MRKRETLFAVVGLGVMLGVVSAAQAEQTSTVTTNTGRSVVIAGGPPSSASIPTVLPAAERPADPGDDNVRVCRQRDTMGTRLRAVRVCRTKAEWRLYDNTGRKQGKTLIEQRPDGLRDPRMGGG
ncbi:MAG: hypothetical protein HC777_03795 [Hyphomonadaceae bacterium]|nr:hypothetical protein [Hyphomonadaceae bacterium]